MDRRFLVTSDAANLRRELSRIPFGSLCHPEAAESLATRETPNEGPMQADGISGAANESIGPSTRKKRGPQDDNMRSDVDVFRALVRAGQRSSKFTCTMNNHPKYPLRYSGWCRRA
ncbi:MAG: hypothetical protein ACRD3P_16050 [Terriglobales bacterium]